MHAFGPFGVDASCYGALVCSHDAHISLAQHILKATTAATMPQQSIVYKLKSLLSTSSARTRFGGLARAYRQQQLHSHRASLPWPRSRLHFSGRKVFCFHFLFIWCSPAQVSTFNVLGLTIEISEQKIMCEIHEKRASARKKKNCNNNNSSSNRGIVMV